MVTKWLNLVTLHFKAQAMERIAELEDENGRINELLQVKRSS